MQSRRGEPEIEEPDPYRSSRMDRPTLEPLPPRRRQIANADDYHDERDDFDDRPREQDFDPHARATAWEKVRRGLWYVQIAVILYVFAQVLQIGLVLARGPEALNPQNMDSGMLAVGCGGGLMILVALVFVFLGRLGCIRTPYVPARGWAKGSFYLMLGGIACGILFFCMFVVAIAAMGQGPNGGGMAILGLSMLVVVVAGLLAVGSETAAAMTMVRIGQGLKDSSTVIWGKFTLGLLVFLTAISTVGLCGFAVYASGEQQKKNAGNPPFGNPGNKFGNKVANKIGNKAAKNAPLAKDDPEPELPAQQLNPLEDDGLDDQTRLALQLSILAVIFVYLGQLSIAMYKTRTTIRQEVRRLRGEEETDRWRHNHED